MGPKFHGNHNYVTIKVILLRIFVFARLQHILLMDVVIRKIFMYLAFIIIDVVNDTSGLTPNQIEDDYSKKKNFGLTI